MFTIAIGVAIVALLMLMMSRSMAEDTGQTVSSTKVYHGGGDSGIVHLLATAAITPGDNVEPVGDYGIKTCDAGAEEYIGTADTNDKGGELAGTEPISTDYANGDVVPVITGPCIVRKITEGVVANGKILRPGTTDGGEVMADTTSTAKYTIGRSISPDAIDNEAIMMRQW